MTVVLDLPPEVEARIYEAAEAEGVDTATYIRKMMAAYVPFPAAPASMTERDLLEEINRGFPEAFWSRFRALVAKLNAGSLTPEEQKELTAHTDRTENRDAERLTYLIELSKRRGVTVQALMAELGLHPVSFE